MVDDEFPWPRKGDQLVRDDEEDWWHNARLNLFYDNWDVYAEGYKVAGDVLVEYIKEKQFYQDYLVYPIVFLYRQYIELRLKAIIRDGNQLLDIPEEFPRDHKIDKLWEQCRKVIEKVWAEDPAENLDAVEECILQFSEIDHTSQKFRYPTDKSGNPSLPDLSLINLRNFAEVITRTGSLLDGVSMGISVAIGYKREMEAEYSDPF